MGPIVGDGTELAAIRQRSGQLAVDDSVPFAGRFPTRRCGNFMSTSDVCVNPDRANEMNDTYMMNKILEYMALGKPIVECDLTGGRFSAGQASLYARPDEVADFALELRELHDNSEQHAAMGATGTRRGRNQPAWHHQVPRLVEAYAAAMKSSPARKVPIEP